MQPLELLAPARDLETAVAAVNSGADAVYIGASRFGAREAAGNDLEAIEELTHYAHRYWAKVYVTVNTLLYESELPAAERLIWQLYNLGADAIIVQDVGLLECRLPPVPLFASTQMHNHTPERVQFLERVGFQRVILARELSLHQIKAIRSQTSIELESFIHGALCVSYSGQCYMSYALGGRSGNRGQCAQPCRRLYSLIDGTGEVVVKDRYLLSLHDLNLSGYLRELVEAGVTSFKIEGRLKDKNYVTNVVSHYRHLLDGMIRDGLGQAASSGKCSADFTPDPARTFNRGFTTYFLKGKGGGSPLASPDTPKSVGEPLGKLAELRNGAFRLESSIELHAGDGLCFFDSQRELRGTTVQRVDEGWVIPASPEELAVGLELYRNHDHEFLAQLQKSRITRKIGTVLRLDETPQGLVLHMRDEDGNEASSEIISEKPLAQKPEQALATLEKQLHKLGETDFECTALEINLPSVYFVQVALLNELRRTAAQQLTVVREKNRPRPDRPFVPNDTPFPTKDLAFTGNVLNPLAESFYRRHGVEHVELGAESGLDMHGRVVMTTKFCLRYQMGACLQEAGAARLTEPLTLVDEQGVRFNLRFQCAACEMQVLLSSESGSPKDLNARAAK